MTDTPRNCVLAGSTLFLILALPADLADIWAGLARPNSVTDWRLSLGLGLKTLMTVGAIAGLAADRTFGYTFLLGASLQITLIRTGDFLALGSLWTSYPRQLALPAADLLFRVGCFVFLAQRWKRLLGVQGGQRCPPSQMFGEGR